ncbi:hypothetical protein LTR84_006545 [Exophiala bonariae]|uniref:RING-type domain-containing protein n=1 Tax=Exophiala bonariae TaxID=1690606 RepID=A0AAV9N1K4_9EURO|nr:hypothetical protein LTR84_006545 [Exophiala bonariae]
MLAANAGPLQQSVASLGLDFAPLPILDLQTQPYRISQINHFDRSFAESQLKHEATSIRGSQRFLRRVTSRLSRPDTTFTAAALSSHVESNGTAVVAQIYIEMLEVAAAHSSEKFEVPGNLIITAAKNSNLELVKLLASFSSVNSLGLALGIAILNRDQSIVRILLEKGGDTDHLPLSTLSSVAVVHQQIFQLILQAPKQLPYHKFGYLCAEAIHNGSPNALAVLLRRLPDYTILAESASKWNRDILLQIAIASQYESAFFAVAAATASWPLLDGQLFFHVLDYARPLIVQDMMDVLLGLHSSSFDLPVQTQLESLLCRCIEDGSDDILRSFVDHGLQISARVTCYAVERRKQQSLEILLRGNIQGDAAILSCIESSFGQSAEPLRERVLSRLLHCQNRGSWIQQELLRAVFVSQTSLISPLVDSGASVDFNHGECLKFAVIADNIPVVKALLAHDVALSTLQLIFPFIRREEPLSHRLVTKMFLRKGVSGDCVDVVFNELLCDYSPSRDSELLEVFIATASCCQIQSLLVAMEHHDSAIFDKMRLSFGLRYNGVSEWFDAYHCNLVDQLYQAPLKDYVEEVKAADTTASIGSCNTEVMISNSSQQWIVLQKLLALRVPLETISNSFGPDLHTLAPAGLQIILESATLSLHDESHISMLQHSFDWACCSHDYPRSLILASKFPHKLEITNILDILKDEIKEDGESDWFCKVLDLTTPSATGLAVLWQHLQQGSLQAVAPGKVQALLKAGATGTLVSDTLMCSVSEGNHTLVNLVLEHWGMDRCRSGRATFDFKRRLTSPRVETRVAEMPSSRVFYQALGDALSAAITKGDLEMCKLLVTAGAPLIHNERVVIMDAVLSMDAHTLLAFISICASVDDFGNPGVDYALLEAVKFGRPASARAMVEAGGSVLAYDCECLKIAIDTACQGKMEMLEMLTALRPTQDTLSFIAEEMSPRLRLPADNPDRFCEIFGLLHLKGLVEAKYYNPAFVNLCRMKSTTWDNAQSFLEYGAHVTWSEGACMRAAWRHGNLQLFPQLFHQCQEQVVLNNLFETAVSDHTSGKLSGYLQLHEDVLVVLAPLLVTNLPQNARNQALSKASTVLDPSIQLLELMVETGARLDQDGGETLYRLCHHNLGHSLIKSCLPPMKARLQALKLLFNCKTLRNLPINTFTDSKKNENFRTYLDLILWPDTTPDAFVPTQEHVALFDTMLEVHHGTESSKLIENFLLTTQGLGFISTYCARLGCYAMEVLLSAEIMAPKQDGYDRQIELIIRALQISAPRVLAGFELQRVNAEQFFDCLSDQDNHVTEHQPAPMYLRAIPDCPTTNRYVDTDGFEYKFGVGESKTEENQQQGRSLSRSSMNRLLFLAMKRRRTTTLVSTLLECGAEPHGTDPEGRSALYLATSLQDCYCSAMNKLISKGAPPDDGSLHLATCNQDLPAIRVLLEAGHSLGHRSPLHQDSTVMEAFLRYDHPECKRKTLVATLNILLKDADWGNIVWQARPNLSGIALEGRWPYESISALLEFRPSTGVKTSLLRCGTFRYSLLSAVKKWDTCGRLKDGDRQKLITRLASLGFKEKYYASEGPQPKDAIGIPERLLDADSRSRLLAWQEKECSVCGDKPEEPKDIYSHLCTPCMPKHGWQNEIICKDCLQQCLESRMFPTEDERFPSDNVLCWAPNCGEVLSHPTIQKYADAKRFATYDEALCQKLLHAGQSMAKCSRKDCKGAIWLDPVSDKNVTVFNCPVCDHPGEAAKLNARRKEEEKLTTAFMKKEKKCPKCKMAYHRIEGCDHIVCGKDAHSAAKSLGCGFEFCYLCDADYKEIRAKGNKSHAKSCPHYA